MTGPKAVMFLKKPKYQARKEAKILKMTKKKKFSQKRRKLKIEIYV